MEKIFKLTDLTHRNCWGKKPEENSLTPGYSFLQVDLIKRMEVRPLNILPLKEREGANLALLKGGLNKIMDDICNRYENKYNKSWLIFKLLDKALEQLGFSSELTQIKDFRERINSNITQASESAAKYVRRREVITHNLYSQ